MIAPEDPRTADVRALLERHLAYAHETTAREDVHALDVDALLDPRVTLYSARDEHGALLGVAAVKALHDGAGEIKSMHTTAAARGRGVGRALVDHLVAVARERDYRALLLETGAQPAFAPARRLYARAGFVPCGAFGGYRDKPTSAFMTLPLDGAAPVSS